MLFSTALTRLISELAATPKIRVPTYADNAPTWSRHRQLETYRKYLQRALNILEAYRKNVGLLILAEEAGSVHVSNKSRRKALTTTNFRLKKKLNGLNVQKTRTGTEWP